MNSVLETTLEDFKELDAFSLGIRAAWQEELIEEVGLTPEDFKLKHNTPAIPRQLYTQLGEAIIKEGLIENLYNLHMERIK